MDKITSASKVRFFWGLKTPLCCQAKGYAAKEVMLLGEAGRQMAMMNKCLSNAHRLSRQMNPIFEAFKSSGFFVLNGFGMS